MSIEENKALIRQLYAEMDRRKAAPEELYDEHFTLIFNGSAPMNTAGANQFASMFYAAFPDLTHTVEALIAEADHVAAKVVARGTHQAELMGLPPTGKQIQVIAFGIFRIAHGKVLEQEGGFDQMTMLQQLGVAPVPAASGV